MRLVLDTNTAVSGLLWHGTPGTLIDGGPMGTETHMEKVQVYLRKEELDALRAAAKRSGRSVADLVCEAIRKVVLIPQAQGPVAVWGGTPKRPASDHDSICDQV